MTAASPPCTCRACICRVSWLCAGGRRLDVDRGLGFGDRSRPRGRRRSARRQASEPSCDYRHCSSAPGHYRPRRRRHRDPLSQRQRGGGVSAPSRPDVSSLRVRGRRRDESGAYLGWLTSRGGVFGRGGRQVRATCGGGCRVGPTTRDEELDLTRRPRFSDRGRVRGSASVGSRTVAWVRGRIGERVDSKCALRRGS